MVDRIQVLSYLILSLYKSANRCSGINLSTLFHQGVVVSNSLISYTAFPPSSSQKKKPPSAHVHNSRVALSVEHYLTVGHVNFPLWEGTSEINMFLALVRRVCQGPYSLAKPFTVYWHLLQLPTYLIHTAVLLDIKL